jgi:Caspase domain
MYQPYYSDSWALVIGINDYQYASRLSYACNDAEAVASVLVNELHFPKSQLSILKDGGATRQAIMDAYLGLVTEASNSDDRVFVFFAGHGTTVKGSKGEVGYLVPVDGDPRRLASLVRWDELIRNAELIPAKHILFIMDACYSGLMMKRALPHGTGRFISDMLQRPSRQVLTAGKADETVADYGGGPAGTNSIFTGYLVEGLRGAAKGTNGVLTANLLMNYVYQKVGQDSRSQQTPHYGHIEGDGDFILLTPDDSHLSPGGVQDSLVQPVIEMPEVEPSQAESIIKPTYAVRNGYVDSDSPSFGRNDWSKKLGEAHYERDAYIRTIVKANSWLSLIIEPIANQSISINIADEVGHLRSRRVPDDLPPYKKFLVPFRPYTTIDSAAFYGECLADETYWGNYLRIEESGNIEYVDTNCAFTVYAGVRQFEYVTIVGMVWQFMFFAQSILANAGYTGGVRYLVNLVGTRNTILGDLSTQPGQGSQWVNPSHLNKYSTLLKLKCPNVNLQLEYKFALRTLSEASSREVVDDVARRLGLAYNHQSALRCFNYGTGIFPWEQYFARLNKCSELSR